MSSSTSTRSLASCSGQFPLQTSSRSWKGHLSPPAVTIGRRSDKWRGVVAASADLETASSCRSLVTLAPHISDPLLEENNFSTDKIKLWLRNYVSEIVRNLRSETLLVHLFAGDNGDVARVEWDRTVTPESWPEVKNQWRNRQRRRPEGLILVEEIKDSPEGENNDSLNSSRKWGLVVQGRGGSANAAFYVMTTSRAGTVGLCSCTYYTLVPVQCFGDPVALQLRNAWLAPRRSPAG